MRHNNINMRNIKIDTISKTITFEKSVTLSEIRQLIESLNSYNIIIQEPSTDADKIIETSIDKNKPSGNRINNDGSGFNPAKSQESLGEKLFRERGKHKFLVKNCQNKVCYCDGTCNTPRINYSTYNSFPMPNPDYLNTEPQCSTTTNLQNFLYDSEKNEQ